MKPISKYHCLGLFYTMVLILILLAPELGQTTQAQKVNDNELIALKVRFHLPNGIMMESKGQKMTVWVTPKISKEAYFRKSTESGGPQEFNLKSKALKNTRQ